MLPIGLKAKGGSFSPSFLCNFFLEGDKCNASVMQCKGEGDKGDDGAAKWKAATMQCGSKPDTCFDRFDTCFDEPAKRLSKPDKCFDEPDKCFDEPDKRIGGGDKSTSGGTKCVAGGVQWNGGGMQCIADLTQ